MPKVAEKFRKSAADDPFRDMLHSPCIVYGDSRTLFSDPLVNHMMSVTFLYAAAHHIPVFYYQYLVPPTQDLKNVPSCKHISHGARAASWCKLLAIIHATSLKKKSDPDQKITAVLTNEATKVENPLCSSVMWIDSDSMVYGQDDLATFFRSPQNGTLNYSSQHLFFPLDAPWKQTPNAGNMLVKNSIRAQEILLYWWNDALTKSYSHMHPYEQKWLEIIMPARKFPSSELGVLPNLTPMVYQEWRKKSGILHAPSYLRTLPSIITTLAHVLSDELSSLTETNSTMTMPNFDPLPKFWAQSCVKRDYAKDAWTPDTFALLDDENQSQRLLFRSLQPLLQQGLFSHFMLDGFSFRVTKQHLPFS